MNKPAIENSDRGITLNKSLAWTMALALVGGGIWVGIEVNAARSGIETLSVRQNEDRAEIRANASQIAAMRSQNARTDARLESIENSQLRIEGTLTEIVRFLRDQR